MLYICLLLSVQLTAGNDTLIEESIKTVVITDRITDISVERLIDSSNSIKSFNLSLADLLGRSSLAYVKTYYPGGLNSVSIKGSGASHSNLLWDGIPLNSAMNGQPDYFLIPASFFDRISISSGALARGIGGDVHLGSSSEWNTNRVSAALSYGSFNTQKANFNFLLSSERISWRSALSYTASDNNFSYVDVFAPNNPAVVLQNANYHSLHLKEGVTIRHRKNIFDFSTWLSFANRQIPPIMGAALNAVEHQKDQTTRFKLNWSHFGESSHFDATIAYFNEWNFYRLNENIASNHRLHSYHSTIGFFKRLKDVLLENTLTYNFTKANSTDLKSDNEQHELQLLSGLKWNMSNRSLFQAGYRFGLKNDETTPFAPFVSYSFNPYENYLSSLNLQAGRKYKIPTLNDQFWTPGGNPLLNIEKAWHIDLIANWRSHHKAHKIDLNFNPYIKWIDNLIIWAPRNGFWTPDNLKSIVKRGVTMDLKATVFLSNDMKFSAYSSHTYTRATSTASFIEEDASIGKQLLYVPKYQTNSGVSSGWREWSIGLDMSYISQRFNSSDNTSSVPSILHLDANLIKTLKFRDQQLSMRLGVNNILNRQHQSIALRPMPGRNYEVSILYNIEKLKK
ncbi:MAG: TonB-dependent receptor plug domain-containing protein [Chitinophagales bacterium]|nr:TonB-dependent receptor plug domain-containing protein [Chitinophagales bacterium]